ncbi:hypothetical protein [Burkholderia thailandensis]|uniref:hypothetical protein n=1 Tax=Burkholderia thailandensis TaxID=57975 RepID=UPI000FD6526F|nr:hypothetical protein [Burkholderia thailandensis]
MHLDAPEAWPAELKDLFDHHHKLLLNWETVPEQVGTRNWEAAIQAVAGALVPYAITGWHCTRLTDSEVLQIVSNGMQLPDGAMLCRRIDALVQTGMLAREAGAGLVARNQAEDSNRARRLWFCFFPPGLAGESGIGRFFRHWGGEALYNSHEHDCKMSALLRAIGTPCIVEANVPIASLAPGAGLAMKLVRRYLIARGYQTEERVEHEDQCVRPLAANCIRRVIRYPEPEFLALTGCAAWRAPL